MANPLRSGGAKPMGLLAGRWPGCRTREECADATLRQTQPYEPRASLRISHLCLSASFTKGDRGEKVCSPVSDDGLSRALGWFATGGRPPAGGGGGRKGYGGHLGRSGE